MVFCADRHTNMVRNKSKYKGRKILPQSGMEGDRTKTKWRNKVRIKRGRLDTNYGRTIIRYSAIYFLLLHIRLRIKLLFVLVQIIFPIQQKYFERNFLHERPGLLPFVLPG